MKPSVGDRARALVARAVAALGPDGTVVAALDKTVAWAATVGDPRVVAYIVEHRDEIRAELAASPVGWSSEMTLDDSCSASIGLHPSCNFLPERVVVPVLLVSAVVVAVDAAESETLPEVGLGEPRHRLLLPPGPRPRVYWRSTRADCPDLGGERDVLTAYIDELGFVAWVNLVGERELCMHLLTALWSAMREGRARPTIGTDAGRYTAGIAHFGPRGVA